MAISTETSEVLFGISRALSLEIGENRVSTSFIAARCPFIVVLPSTLPVIIAVSSPNFDLTNAPTFVYRYSAVSEKAEKIRILWFPLFIGFVSLLSIKPKRVCSFVSCFGVMSSISIFNSSSVSASSESLSRQVL